MITNLNLATKPFRNRVLPYFLSALLLVIAGTVAIVCLAVLKQNSDAEKLLAAKITDRQSEISRLKGEGEKVQQQLTPDQKAILSASHKLVDNKMFGWSRLFADLESVLPPNVSASRIHVQNVFNDNGRIKAELDLSVLSKDYAPVKAMIDNMHNSGFFQAELRGQDRQQGEHMIFSEFSLRLVYTPGYGYPAATGPDVAQNNAGGGQ